MMTNDKLLETVYLALRNQSTVRMDFLSVPLDGFNEKWDRMYKMVRAIDGARSYSFYHAFKWQAEGIIPEHVIDTAWWLLQDEASNE